MSTSLLAVRAVYALPPVVSAIWRTVAGSGGTGIELIVEPESGRDDSVLRAERNAVDANAVSLRELRGLERLQNAAVLGAVGLEHDCRRQVLLARLAMHAVPGERADGQAHRRLQAIAESRSGLGRRGS